MLLFAREVTNVFHTCVSSSDLQARANVYYG